MMIPPLEFKHITNFRWNDLNKKFGRIVVVNVEDPEQVLIGFWRKQVWFVDYDNMKMYKLEDMTLHTKPEEI